MIERLSVGSVTELGIPCGKEGRPAVLHFLKTERLILWVNGHLEWQIFPPAFFARDIQPDRIFFANSDEPVKDLKHALLKPLFSAIVFDVGRKQISKEEMAFLGIRSRINHQVVIVIRDYFLSNRFGNPWAKWRFNIAKREGRKSYVITAVRGAVQRQTQLHLS